MPFDFTKYLPPRLFWAPEDLPDLLGPLDPSRGELRTLGHSREGRPLYGLRFGHGQRKVTLIAGAHADEPVGPLALLALCRFLARSSAAGAALRAATFRICPHVNPDGAHRNRPWTDQPALKPETYLAEAVREAPGDDIEFGFPTVPGDGCRPENRAVADFLQEFRGESPNEATVAFHASLHGMAIAEGAWFLLGKEGLDGTGGLRADLASLCKAFAVSLHDWDRGGEKGFEYVEAGFSTAPTCTAMKAHFESAGDQETASRFRPSSMEFVRDLGGNPRCMVSEIPLFHLEPTTADKAPSAENFLRARAALQEARFDLATGKTEALQRITDTFKLASFDTATAVHLILAMVFLGSELASLDEWLPPR